MIILLSMVPFLFLGVAAFIWLIYAGYGFYGAWSVLKGKAFRYLILGHRLERYLSQ